MKTLIEALIVRLMLFLGIVCAIVLMVGCGPLTPHVDVSAEITGAVDTSGNITMSLDLTSLTQFFMTQCQIILGPQAPPSAVELCAANMTNNFLAFLNQPNKG